MRSIGYVVYLLQRVLTQYRWEEGKVIKIEQLKRAFFILIQNGGCPLWLHRLRRPWELTTYRYMCFAIETFQNNIIAERLWTTVPKRYEVLRKVYVLEMKNSS